MTKFIVAAKKFVAQEEGAAAAEYALLLAIVGAGIAIAATTLGSSISTVLTGAATKIDTVTFK